MVIYILYNTKWPPFQGKSLPLFLLVMKTYIAAIIITMMDVIRMTASTPMTAESTGTVTIAILLSVIPSLAEPG